MSAALGPQTPAPFGGRRLPPVAALAAAIVGVVAVVVLGWSLLSAPGPAASPSPSGPVASAPAGSGPVASASGPVASTPPGSVAPSASAEPLALVPWNELDTRWGTYLSEREWGNPREAVGGNGWGMDYLRAIKVPYAWGEDGIAGLTTRDGAFDLAWAVWDEKQVVVTERYFGWSNPSGPNGEAIVDRRTFHENTPTSSYTRTVMEYPAASPAFEIAFESARADTASGVMRATATNTGTSAAPVDVVLKGWFHEPALRVERTDDGLLLHGASSVVAIAAPRATSAQVSDRKSAIDANLRAGGLTGDGPGNIGALAYRLQLDPAASQAVTIAWAEAPDAATAQARARALLPRGDEVAAARAVEAGPIFSGRVTQHEDLYVQALRGLVWSQSLYTWDGTSSYDPAWDGKVDANDVLIMPDTWEFPWLASWDTGFQAVAATLIEPQLAADQLRFLLSDSWQQPDGHIPCAEWVMATECPPIFAWSALRVANAMDPAAAGDDFLREVYPGLKANYDYWWKTNAVEPDGLFTGGFLGMDNLPRAKGMAQADASAWMAFFARNMATIADRLGESEAAARYAADADRVAAAVNTHLWDEAHGFYYDLDADGTSFIPTRSYTGLIPLIAGIVPADRLPRVLDALRDPAEFLSPYGIRSTSAKSVLYEPGYSSTRGVNSNWLGPVWIPINYLLVQALADVDLDLATTVRESVVNAVEADWLATGRIHEYYDAETGAGIGADAQTGWSALVANLIEEGWPGSAPTATPTATPAP
jgi:hypothetical protein